MTSGRGNYSPLHAAEDTNEPPKYVPLDLSTEEESGQNSNRAFLSGRRRYFAAGFAVVLIVSVVTLAAVLGTQSDFFLGSRSIRSSTKFTFEEVLNGVFQASGYSTKWITDDTYVVTSYEDGLKEYNLSSNSSSALGAPELISEYGGSYKLSHDRQWIMFKQNSTQLYRHSAMSDYFVGRISDRKLKKLVLPNNQEEKIRYATWCGPSNSVVFIFRNNVYYKHQADSPSSYQITTDGVPKAVFNGVPDWVYEEEILATDNAVECSEDGKWLIFTKFNSSKVRYFKFTKYGPRTHAYTSIEKIAYPKPGYENPVVSLYAVNLNDVIASLGKNVKLINLEVPQTFKEKEHYYYIMKFVTGTLSKTKPQVFVSWMNRAQNHTVTEYYDLPSASHKTVQEHMVKGGWVDDDYPKPKFSKDGTYFLNLLPKSEGSAGFFRHLAQVKTEGTQSVRFLTSGKWELQDIVCFNPEEEIAYYRSTEGDPATRHVYQINIKDGKRKCITCGYGDDKGCSYYYPQFSKQCTWVNLRCQGPGVPFNKLRNLKTGKSVLLEDNKSLRDMLKGRSMPKKVRYTVKSDGFDLPVEELRPPDFDERSNKKYAVFFSVYGGPGTQKVVDTFEVFWDQFLVTNYDIILVYFDARGCGYYGDKFLHAVYRQLGKYEAIDADAVARYLVKQPYVDKDRIGMWGWSYGGFYTASVLAHSDIFKVGISVAPVTDWRYYDTIYTERYMGLPTKEDNLAGYEKSSILPSVSNFAKKKFLLVHGTGDDNVHVQQTMQLANALISKRIQFRMQIYPDRTHNIQSNGASMHLYLLLTKFIEKRLSLEKT